MAKKPTPAWQPMSDLPGPTKDPGFGDTYTQPKIPLVPPDGDGQSPPAWQPAKP